MPTPAQKKQQNLEQQLEAEGYSLFTTHSTNAIDHPTIYFPIWYAQINNYSEEDVKVFPARDTSGNLVPNTCAVYVKKDKIKKTDVRLDID